jgi:hypothetical protein
MRAPLLYKPLQPKKRLKIFHNIMEVASTGSRAAGREAQTPRLAGACERQARGFLGGALFCVPCVKKKNA